MGGAAVLGHGGGSGGNSPIKLIDKVDGLVCSALPFITPAAVWPRPQPHPVLIWAELPLGHTHSPAHLSIMAVPRPGHAPSGKLHCGDGPAHPATPGPAPSCRRRGSASERDGGAGGVQGRVPAAVPERPRRARPAPPPPQEETAGRHRQSRVSPGERRQRARPCAVPGFGNPPKWPLQTFPPSPPRGRDAPQGSPPQIGS